MRSGRSLQQVADAVSASKAHIWELETGKSANPSIELLRKLAELFEVPVAELIGETTEGVDPDFIKMHRDYSALSATDRAVIEDMMKAMKKRRAKEGTGGS